MNKYLIQAREAASVAAEDLSLQTFEREIRISALNSNKVLCMGVLNHACSCPNYRLYNACKHALSATMYTTHQDPLEMSTRALLPDAAVQVVHVELVGPLRPCKMPRIRQFDRAQCFDFNWIDIV
jgi:SWIM zinc finger